MTFANTTLEAFSNLALAQFETLFWEACADQDWSLLTNDTGDKVNPKMLQQTLQNKLYSGPRETIQKLPEPSDPSDITQLPTEPAPVETAPVAAPTPVQAQPTPSEVAKIDPKKVKGLKFKGANVDLPYMPDLIDYTKCCQGVKINGGLLSPCLTHVKSGGFCKPCQKIHDEGKADGTLSDRQAVPLGQFVSKKSGKTEISFATYLAKRDSTIDEFNTFLAGEIGANFQVPLTDAYTSIDKKKAKKASKKKGSGSGESSDSDSETQPKRKPGRPKGTGNKAAPAAEVTNTSVENELFPSETDENGPACDTEAEKLREQNTETVGNVETASDDADDVEADDIDVEIDENELADDDDGVVHFEEDGVKYARDDENSVFRVNDEGDPEECVGSWDPIAKKVIIVNDM